MSYLFFKRRYASWLHFREYKEPDMHVCQLSCIFRDHNCLIISNNQIRSPVLSALQNHLSWSIYSEKFVYLYCNIPLFPFVCTIIENITLIPNFTENGTPLGGTSRARHTYGICIPFPVKMGTVLTSLFPLSDTPGIYRCMFSNCFKHKIDNVGVSVL